MHRKFVRMWIFVQQFPVTHTDAQGQHGRDALGRMTHTSMLMAHTSMLMTHTSMWMRTRIRHPCILIYPTINAQTPA
eukprot:6657-Eustigmatos_ZCMA.PRE.1